MGSHRTPPPGPLPFSFPVALLCHLTHGLFPCPPSKPQPPPQHSLQTLMSGAIATWTCRAEHLCFHRNLWIGAGGAEQHSQQGFASIPNHPLHFETPSPKISLHSTLISLNSTEAEHGMSTGMPGGTCAASSARGSTCRDVSSQPIDIPLSVFGKNNLQTRRCRL